MNLAKKLVMSFAALSCFAATQTIAGPLISIGSMYEVLKSDQRNISKRIYNSGDSSAFVRVDVMHIDVSGKDKEAPVLSLKDNELIKDRLLVTPMRMIIPPNNFQTSRILWSGKRTSEQYYRVRYTPVMPGKNDGFGLNDAEISDYRQKAIQAGINVLAGYGTVVIVHPDNPTFNTQIKQDKNSITLINSGNATVAVEDVRVCKSKAGQCDLAARAFILPGKTHSISKYEAGKSTFSLLEGSQRHAMSY